MSEPLTLTKDNFAETIKTGVTVVDFWAEWCTPCKMIAPIIKELSNEYEGKAKIGKLDTDSNPEVAGLYGIVGIPTLIVFKDGNIVDRLTGAGPKQMYIDLIEKHLG